MQSTSTVQEKRTFDPKELSKALNPAASLAFHKILFYDFYWYPIYFILMVISFYFKGQVLTYPRAYLEIEVIILSCSLFLKFMKIFNGTRGNNREISSYIIFAIIFSIAGILTSLFFMIF